MKEGDTIVINMLPNEIYVGGRFEIRPKLPVNVILNGNGATLDVRERVGSWNSGVEGQAILVPITNVVDYTVRNLTIIGSTTSDDRCMRLNQQRNVVLEDITLFAPRDGIQGSCDNLTMRRVKVVDSGAAEKSGRDHAVYVFCKKFYGEDLNVTTVNGHGLKIISPSCELVTSIIKEGIGNTGGSLNWANGEGTFTVDRCLLGQIKSVGNNAMVIIAGNADRFVGSGVMSFKDTTFIDSVANNKRIIQNSVPPVTVKDLGGNKYNDLPYDLVSVGS